MEQDDVIKSGCLLFPPAGGNVFNKFPKKVTGRIGMYAYYVGTLAAIVTGGKHVDINAIICMSHK